MILQKLHERGLISPPKWLPDNTQFLTIMGSEAYGVASNESDIDIYGWCIPTKELVFPHLAGEITGFGQQIQRFEVWQQHHVKENLKEYDFSVYSIVKYFQLSMQCNPNMIDSLFVPRRCILHSTAISEHMREHRKMFLHKGAWHKFKGYAYAQISKYKPENREKLKPILEFQSIHAIQNTDIINRIQSELSRRGLSNGVERSVNTGLEHLSNDELLKYADLLVGLSKRDIDLLERGVDTKSMYHVVRLLNEVEQIMVEHDLDLERNREQLKAIRRGEWSLEQLKNYFSEKEKALEATYSASSLPYGPNEPAIKQILIDSLEMHYGNLSAVVVRNPSMDRLIDDLRTLVARYDFPVVTEGTP